MAQSIADQFDGKVATAPIKSRERALEKIVNDYRGDAFRIKDLARNTIIVPATQIDSVASALAHNGAAVKRINAATDPLGYSGVNSSLKTKNGFTGEIQVNSPEMIYAKETPKNARAILGNDVYDSISAKTGIEGGLGHKLYEQWRALPDGNPSRLPIEAQSKAYYDAIRSKAGISGINSTTSGFTQLSRQSRRYLNDLEVQTGFKVTADQRTNLANVLREQEFTKLSPELAKTHRADFNRVKDDLITQWEQNTGQAWPRYTQDVLAKNKVTVIRKVGQPFDAHHIIESSYGGPNKWWNMHPARFPDQHQAGIHRAGGVAREIFSGN